MQPIKANNANSWIVQRMTATEAPNYYLTTDFKNYIPISDVQPQKSYNWLTAEVIKWQQKDGTIGKGILYKPENFDPRKKYPIIFHCYEKMVHEVYQFPTPELANGPINIPWFVSRGYLVFTPDIEFVIGKPGQSAFKTLVSAAELLSRRPYVDSKKMGIQGHSFGGFETNYLITHTHIFSAAAEGAGVCDFISGYGSLRGSGISCQYLYETSQNRLAATLWQRPNLYINNSPILMADKITTPLLIMHNKKDENVPWNQGVELFTALRRLGKKVWMLQYDEGYHVVYGKDLLDYTLRLTQFFDFYLKDQPPPIWMAGTIPARLKGIEPGYELDLSGKMP
jgi:dipeptidyl aminopeptidase/acylaminoacyl peptidase